MEIGQDVSFRYRKVITMVNRDGTETKSLSPPYTVEGKIVKVGKDYLTLDLGERFPKVKRFRTFNFERMSDAVCET